MASILINIEKNIEVAAADVLKFLTHSQAAVNKAEPAVVAALGVLLGAVETALAAVGQASATPLDIPLDIETVADLRAVWPDVMSFAKALGIKL